MANELIDDINDIFILGPNVEFELIRINPTQLQLKWNVPPASVYNGCVIVVSNVELAQRHQPKDGVTYKAQPDLSSALPANMIGGNGHIVAAIYNDTTIKSVTVSGLDPDSDYYAAIHICSNVKQYYTFGVKSYPDTLNTDAYAGNINQSYEPPMDPSVGDVYYNIDNNTVQMWNGAIWMPAGNGTVNTGTQFSPTPKAGDFFYNITNRILFVYTGSEWKSTEKSAPKGPMYMAQNVGTDNSYDERSNLIQVLKYQLGWPKVCVELEEAHFNICIDNALQEFRMRADSAYYRRHMFLDLQPGQQTYFLNDPTKDTNRISSIIKVHRSNRMGYMSSGADAIFNQPFYQQMFNGQMFDLTSYHLLMQYSETFNLLFAGEINFEWRETTRELRIYKQINSVETVLLECMVEKTEQEILMDRYSTQFIQDWALAEAKITLGNIRSKFSSVPGVGGSISLNGNELIAKGEEEQRDLLQSIYNYERGNGSDIGSWGIMIG